jgi:DNA-directed RNA polymerase specialized sigma subunit
VASKEYRLIEVILSNYHFLKDIIAMETEVNNLKGMRYQHTTSEGNNTSDPTEKAAIRKIERDKDVLKINVLVNLVDRAIKRLPELEQQTIENFYIKQHNWNDVSRIVHCSVRHCKRKRSSGISLISKFVYLDNISEYYSIMSRLCPDNVPIMSCS